MATTRLRKTFAYPSDTDPQEFDLDLDLDEQEQDTLLSTLQTHDTATNALYVKAFTTLPLASIPAFLFYLFSPGTRGSVRLLCLLAVTSLGASGLEMWFVPVSDLSSASGTGGCDDDDDGGVSRHLSRRRVRRIPFSDVEIDEDGPLGRVLPWLNVGICGLLGLAGWGLMLKGRRDGGNGGNGAGGEVPDGFWAFCFLPGVILGVVTVARRSMREVEAGLGELRGLRYGYKGA